MTARKAKNNDERGGIVSRHFRHHHRFYAGALAAAAVFAASWSVPLPVRSLLAGDAFFLVYLGFLAGFAARSTRQSTMRHARIEDEGVSLIALLTLAIVAVSLTAIVTIMDSAKSLDGIPLIAAIISVPLGWATMHASVALHYARLYYAAADNGASREGLEFPNNEKPDVGDFLYFSFVLGMTAQTSDVQITGRRMRRSVLMHSIVSYFYNAVIIALTVNAALQIAG